MVGRARHLWLVVATFAAGASITAGCGESSSKSSDASETGGSATGGSATGGSATGGTAGLVSVQGGSGGGTSTCATGGSAGSATGGNGGESDGDPACGVLLYPSRIYGPECQGWMDENCCAELEACADNPVCKMLVDCINACNPVTTGCVSCCARFLTDEPPEFYAISQCTKSGLAPMVPDGCDWPRYP